MQTPRSNTPKPIDTGQQKNTQDNAEAGDKQAAEGAHEGTKPAHSASSSLQMTPTDLTFAENDEADEEEDKIDDTHRRQAEAGKSEAVAATEERAVEPAPEQSKEPTSMLAFQVTLFQRRLKVLREHLADFNRFRTCG